MLSKLGKLTGHLHLCAEVPAAAELLELIPAAFLDAETKEELKPECHLDLKIVDRSDDGNYEIEVLWDLPGTAFDSGKEPRRIPIPIATLLGPTGELFAHALEGTGAPDLLVGVVRNLLK